MHPGILEITMTFDRKDDLFVGICLVWASAMIAVGLGYGGEVMLETLALSGLAIGATMVYRALSNE
jgi:hypothetical protein